MSISLYITQNVKFVTKKGSNKVEDDIVLVTCYGDTKEYNREEAIDFFKEGMLWCDPGSSEYSRYAMIVDQLESGSTHACDTVSEQESVWQALYNKHDGNKYAEALKKSYRELKEELEDDTWDDSYLDEVAEAASEQRAKAMGWCEQQLKDKE